MKRSGLAALAAAAALPAVTTAQQSGWEANQVNATMCYWEQLRATVVQDVLYMDGGRLWWIPGMADGQYGPIADDGNPLGLVYTLNFSTPFNTTQNISAILQTISKAPNGGAANNIAPNYYDGAMLGNDYEWFLYGGMLKNTRAFTPPREDDVTAYQAYSYGVAKPGFRPGFLNDRLDEGVTRYVAYGGAANAPSENKAWYFSGLRAPGFGEIYTPSGNDSLMATNVSNTLITLDMTTQQQEHWKNTTLPDFIAGRANPELVWVPVGQNGILVALGGVVYPDFATVEKKSANEAASAQESPKFMTTIDIYDIANDKWYQQPTIGGPQALARGCAVVASAQDYSSHNIYYYGGYDGIHPSDPFNDDVWILSLPSFMWMKVFSSKSQRHGRAGHKCVKPYPDQMFVVGGYASLAGTTPTCVDGGILQVFNLTSGKWLNSYDPEVYSNYGVPEMIYNMIGGSETGGATMTTPTPTGWATPELAQVFAKPYETSKIKSFYPYTPNGPGGTRPEYNSGGGGVPGFVAPLLGTVCGLMLLSAIVVGIMLYRRRKLLRKGPVSDAGTEDSGNRIFSWLRAQPSEAKAPTVTTTDETASGTPFSPEMEQRTPLAPHAHPIVHYEVADNQVAELPDTSPRVELQDTGLTPVEIINKHSHFATQPAGSLHNSSYYSSIAQADHASTVSRSSGPSGTTPLQPPPVSHATSPVDGVGVRPDSPPLGTPAYESGPGGFGGSVGAAAAGVGTGSAAARGVSGVSGLSERDRAHLRQISDTTVSSVGTRGQGSLEQARGAPLQMPRSPPLSQQPLPPGALPVSPPSPGGREGEDYMNPRLAPSVPGVSPGAANTGSPLRRSVFVENPEDLEERRT